MKSKRAGQVLEDPGPDSKTLSSWLILLVLVSFLLFYLNWLFHKLRNTALNSIHALNPLPFDTSEGEWPYLSEPEQKISGMHHDLTTIGFINCMTKGNTAWFKYSCHHWARFLWVGNQLPKSWHRLKKVCRCQDTWRCGFQGRAIGR